MTNRGSVLHRRSTLPSSAGHHTLLRPSPSSRRRGHCPHRLLPEKHTTKLGRSPHPPPTAALFSASWPLPTPSAEAIFNNLFCAIDQPPQLLHTMAAGAVSKRTEQPSTGPERRYYHRLERRCWWGSFPSPHSTLLLAWKLSNRATPSTSPPVRPPCSIPMCCPFLSCAATSRYVIERRRSAVPHNCGAGAVLLHPRERACSGCRAVGRLVSRPTLCKRAASRNRPDGL
jgi:hypothetical protein